MLIKKIGGDQIDNILALEESSAPDPKLYYRYDRSDLERMFYVEKTAAVFGSFDNEKLVGWASYRQPWNEEDKEGVYEMSSLVVDKEYRRHKIGQQLFDIRLKEILTKPDMKKIYATCHPKNIPIIMLYLKNGFIIYDFKKDKYGPGADRLYLKYENE